MFIKARAVNAGHQGRHRAGRFFPNGETIRLEVVPDAPGKLDPKAPYVTDDKGVKRSSMEQITRSGWEALKADGVIAVLGDDESAEHAAADIVASLRAQLAASQAEVSELKTKVEQLEKAAAKGDGGKDAKEPKAKGDGGKAKD